MKQVKGDRLSIAAQREARARFVNRWTKEHKPGWVHDEKATPPQFASDSDWLANTLFWVRNDGSLSERPSYCESSPTWPDNEELRKRDAARSSTAPLEQ
jgi:hypothetical protein